jgi:hypothetical protein
MSDNRPETKHQRQQRHERQDASLTQEEIDARNQVIKDIEALDK